MACVPLIAHKKTIGAIWIGRSDFINEHEMRLLMAIADMAANAIHRATLHELTQQDALELALAYDTTIEGWSRALDLRDRETEGHTQRVTEMTLRLARLAGMPEEELVHVKRGALLHDIGKMGIPDSILHKPGKLTEQEWAIMRSHPTLAYEMLAPIDYLEPALDIPYCHHEHWDGNGYPRGLRGEQIPLAARIFSVVDVWDALRFDRPYRLGWSQEKTFAHIREQAGKYIDPEIVDLFFMLMDGNT
jgi:putative nucleotidyltransferase with HDIG domain